MRNCLICGVPVDEYRDFCPRCYQRDIHEIDEEVEKKKAPSLRGRIMKGP